MEALPHMPLGGDFMRIPGKCGLRAIGSDIHLVRVNLHDTIKSRHVVEYPIQISKCSDSFLERPIDPLRDEVSSCAAN